MCINFYSFIKVFVEIYYLKNYLPKLALKHRLKFTADVPLHRLAQLKLLQLRRVHGLSSSSLDISPNNRYIFIAKHRLHLLPALLLPTVSLSLWSSLCTILRWTARRISLHHICKALILSVFRLCWSTICSLSLTPIDAHLFAGLATALYSSPNLELWQFQCAYNYTNTNYVRRLQSQQMWIWWSHYRRLLSRMQDVCKLRTFELCRGWIK